MRRGALRALGTGLAVTSAGCSSVAGVVSDPPYLEAVRVKNHDVIAHEVRVAVAQRGEAAHETTFELGKREPREYGGPYRPWEQVDGEWTAATRIDGDDTAEHGEYASVTFRIRDTGAPVAWCVWLNDESRHTPCDGATPTPR